MTPSVLAPVRLLHPRGVVRSVRMTGEWPVSETVPGDAAEPHDLIGIGSPPSGLSARQWLDAELRTAARSLAPDGVAYVLAGRFSRGRVRRLARRHGLVARGVLTHLPDVERTLFLVPERRAAWRYVIDQLILLRRWRHMVAAVAGRSGMLNQMVGESAIVLQRPSGGSLHAWLYALTATPGAVVASRITPTRKSVTLHQVRPDSSLAAIVRVSRSNAEGPSRALGSLLEGARAAGASVPDVVAEARLGDEHAIAIAPLEGQVAATLLGRRPSHVETIMERVARWLTEWAKQTATPTVLSRTLLEEALVEPAQVVDQEIGGFSSYVQWLGERCAEYRGTRTVCCAAHRDLTMWNVVLGEDRKLGVVDWDTAVETALPFLDLPYAAVDATAAAGLYEDRVGAYRACFDGDGQPRAHLEPLEVAFAGEVGVSRDVLRLTHHACWVHHAANEARSAPSGERVFVPILRELADAVTRTSERR